VTSGATASLSTRWPRVTNLDLAHLYGDEVLGPAQPADELKLERENSPMRKLLRTRRLTVLATSLVAAFVLALSTAAVASAFSEGYGGGEICGSNCYIQSGGAHTFYFNEGSARGEPYLACQLFNTNHANEVTHGYGYCDVFYYGGEYVTARVYNQSGTSHVVSGYAET